MRLPLLLSVLHAGLGVPPEAEAYCALTPEQIAEDGDEGAAEIYDLHSVVTAFHTTDVARAIVDMNRSEDDRPPRRGREDPYLLERPGLSRAAPR